MLFRATENVIKLYGNIYEGDGAWISRQLEDIDGQYPLLKIHLHTNGGQVFDGNLIYNTMIGMKSEIHIYIDGLVASMGTILMLAGTKIFMAKNATIMIHAPRGIFRGTSKEMRKAAETLEGMEEVFVESYAEKTGKGEDKARAWMDGDNYFNAKKAIAEGLVDEVVPNVLKATQMKALKEMKVAAVLEAKDELFALDDEEGFQSQQVSNQNSNNDPMKKELIEALQLQGVSAESSDTAIIAAVQSALAAKDSQTNTEKTANQALQAQLDAFKTTAITAAIESAEKAGKITGEMKDHYAKIGKDSGLETLQAILNGIPARQPITSQITGGGGAPVATGGKTWDEMQEKDSKTLEAMADPSHPQHGDFKAMFKTKYGCDFGL